MPNISSVLGIVGGAACVAVMYVMPSLAYTKTFYAEKKKRVIIYLSILSILIIFGAGSTAYSVWDIATG